jgi:5-methylcytosine-specific restriction endonuclease McrA
MRETEDRMTIPFPLARREHGDRHTRKAERITGYEVHISGFILDAVDAEGEVIASATARNTKEASRLLVNEVYRLHCRRVWELQGRRCWHCKRPLKEGEFETDHIVSRAKGRDDRISNLRTVCHSLIYDSCKEHAKRHGNA